ncbi:hypothetical protein TI05_10840 [Achromatium sp. WMS3]|nr:hypothetical protein TI05_10840 [Achromatium sp. WMS3]
MNYWHMNLYPTGEQWTNDDIKNIVLSRTIGMGCDFSDRQEGYFRNTMKIGDLVVVLNGRTPIAVVEVIGDWYKFDCDQKSNSIVWYPSRRAVKILCLKGEKDDDCFTDLPMIPKTNTGTLGPSIDQNSDTYRYIHSLHECCKICEKKRRGGAINEA